MEAVYYYKVVFGMVLIVGMMLSEEAMAATQHVVGGSQGWDESTDYSTWASGQTFKVGDQLVFKYTSGLHSVVELGSESAYKSCDIGSPVDSLNGGNNVVKLDKVGTRYFACGTSGHCGQGMKVKITTVAADATSSSPSSSSPASTTTSSSSGAPVSQSLAYVVSMAASSLVVVSMFLVF